jgi:hypothetical protein
MAVHGGPLALSDDQLKALARHGAQARINELRQEIAAVEQAFPDLRSRHSGRSRKSAGLADVRSEAPRKRRRRSRGWSPAARKAAAVRMKAYWAKRKAGRKK